MISTKTDIYSVLIIAFLSTVFFNPHSNPLRHTLLSLFGRWDRFREIKYSPKATWLLGWWSHYLNTGLSDFWAVPSSLGPEASRHITQSPLVSRTQSKEWWYSWDVFWAPKIYEAIRWFLTTLLLGTFISEETHFISQGNEFILYYHILSISIIITFIQTLVALPWTTKQASNCTLYL